MDRCAHADLYFRICMIEVIFGPIVITTTIPKPSVSWVLAKYAFTGDAWKTGSRLRAAGPYGRSRIIQLCDCRITVYKQSLEVL